MVLNSLFNLKKILLLKFKPTQDIEDFETEDGFSTGVNVTSIPIPKMHGKPSPPQVEETPVEKEIRSCKQKLYEMENEVCILEKVRILLFLIILLMYLCIYNILYFMYTSRKNLNRPLPRLKCFVKRFKKK